MSISLLGALVHTDPIDVKMRILKALEASAGDRRQAAASLGTTHRSFYRLIERLGMWDEVDQLMDARGYPRPPGPPRTIKRIRDAVMAAEGNLGKAARALGVQEVALRARIEQLKLWDGLDRVLVAAGYAKLPRTQ